MVLLAAIVCKDTKVGLRKFMGCVYLGYLRGEGGVLPGTVYVVENGALVLECFEDAMVRRL